MKYGLTETTVESICTVFARFPEIEKAILYGSRAKGNFKTGSDIDLTLCGEALTSDLRSTIASALDDLLLPYTIDLSVFNELNHAKLREHIERVGVLFYERTSQGAAMKKGWQIKILADTCAVFADGDWVESKDQSPEGIRLIQTGNVGEGVFKDRGEKARYISEATFKRLRCTEIFEGDCLISRLPDPVGRSCILPDTGERMITAIDCTIVRFNSKQLIPGFFNYFSQSLDYLKAVEVETTGTTRKRISRSKLAQVAIPVPPLPEQKRIVGILDEAFDGIATAKANAEKNLQNACALFESHLQSVFTQRGKGWVERKLGDKSLLEIIDGDRGVNYPKASDFHDEGHCLFLNTKNVRPDGFDFESTMFITTEKDGQLRKGKLKRNDVVLTTRGTIGNIGLYSDDVPFDNIRINSGMLIFRPNKGALLPTFLFELLRSEIVKDQIRKQTTGAAQPQLPIKTLVNFTIPVPADLEDQRAIVKKIRAFEPETQRLESLYQQKLATLEVLKKSLLHQAFSGQL
jgi:type I restriction enzyme S subunit